MAGDWTDYERNCANLLSLQYEYGNSNIKINPEGEHNAYNADAQVMINGNEAFWVEFKAVSFANDKCVMAPFTMTDMIDVNGNLLLELTDSACEKVNDVEGMLELACEVQERSDEIIPLEGKTAYINGWTQYDDGNIEYAITEETAQIDFQVTLCKMVSNFYRYRKNATWFMIGDTPFPFYNDWQHIYEYFNFYVQVRAKPSGGARIPQVAMASLENTLYTKRIPDNGWYVDKGRMYISTQYDIGSLFSDWRSGNVFCIKDADGEDRKINCVIEDGWYKLKPHPTNLTVMPYGIYNGNIPDISVAWAELDYYMSRCGGRF